MSIDLEAIKAALADIPGIGTLTQATVGGRMVLGFGVSPASFTVGIDPASTADQIIAKLRQVYAARGESAPQPAPAAQMEQPPLQPKAITVSVTTPGGFAASLKALVDEARAGLAQVRADGTAQVQGAVNRLHDAKDATKKVTGNMVKMIEDETASVLAELGQISNDL